MLGNGQLEAKCFDGKTRMCHIRGKMKKKVWVNQGDIILLSLRDFQASIFLQTCLRIVPFSNDLCVFGRCMNDRLFVVPRLCPRSFFSLPFVGNSLLTRLAFASLGWTSGRDHEIHSR
jgi:hypothetical protein